MGSVCIGISEVYPIKMSLFSIPSEHGNRFKIEAPDEHVHSD